MHDWRPHLKVYLLACLQGSIEKSRRLFDGFLAEFPLCYAYWKKYADLEHKHSSPEWAINVFDRGTAAVPYSCDLWGHYCTYLQKIGKPADEIRRRVPVRFPFHCSSSLMC